MKILQVNVRLSEGGAAQIAQTLERELELLGHKSFFLYGYGPAGKKSKAHVNTKHFKNTSKFSAILNLISYRLLGHEFLLFSKFEEIKLRRIISKVDVVHLHAVHSYFLDYSILLKVLTKAEVPIVWTMHDQWIMTGRCAQPGTCRSWVDGCLKCPDLNAYPPAYLDKAARNFLTKRKSIRSFQMNSNLAIVSCAKWLEQELKQAGFTNITTITNSVDSQFHEALSSQSAKFAGDNLFVCRDLRDQNKVDWGLLEEISRIDNQKLTVIGDHPLKLIPGVNFIPSSNSRDSMVSLYKSHQRLVFSSRVDYYPLTVIEALACGLEVYAIDSFAAQEFAWHPKMFIFDSAKEMLNDLKTLHKSQASKNSLAARVDSDFSPRRMAIQYEEIYQELLNRKWASK
jgi:putative colanic acid biosynthesis glycosyltransferase